MHNCNRKSIYIVIKWRLSGNDSDLHHIHTAILARSASIKERKPALTVTTPQIALCPFTKHPTSVRVDWMGCENRQRYFFTDLRAKVTTAEVTLSQHEQHWQMPRRKSVNMTAPLLTLVSRTIENSWMKPCHAWSNQPALIVLSLAWVSLEFKETRKVAFCFFLARGGQKLHWS